MNHWVKKVLQEGGAWGNRAKGSNDFGLDKLLDGLPKVFTSEVQSKMIFMGHQILSCHVPVVRSFFIMWKMLLSS